MNIRNSLQIGDRVPHFVAHSLDGEIVEYATIWQRKNLVLLTLPSPGSDDEYVRSLNERIPAFRDLETTCVLTRDSIAGLSRPGLLVADRWGEIVHILTLQAVSDLPSAIDLLQWLEAIEHRCPECEGEAR